MAALIPGSSQSNRDRAELVALRRLGTVDDCAKVGRVPGYRPLGLCDRGSDPDRRWIGARVKVIGFLVTPDSVRYRIQDSNRGAIQVVRAMPMK
jgi:hypothetical protein